MDDNVTFNISVTMKERWIDHFCSMLRCMETFGNIGHSALVGFYADGDGDFRPKFEIDIPFEQLEGIPKKETSSDGVPEVTFDAG